MKKILNDCDFEKYFDPVILARGKDYYHSDRILDIWCQKDYVTAYVGGSEIYKVKLKFDKNEISVFYCSCPYFHDEDNLCKHVAGVLYYLEENEVLELESSSVKQDKIEEYSLSKIYNEMNYKVKMIGDRRGYINYYNGSSFVNLILKVADYINDFINAEEYNNAFELIKYTYAFINNVQMDGSNGEYQDSFSIVNNVASKLLYNEEYFGKFLDYTKDIALNDTFGDFSDSPLSVFVTYAHDKESAIKAIDILNEVELSSFSYFTNKTKDKIELTYNYIDKESAINLCYEHLTFNGIHSLLIRYLEKDNRIDEVIKLLKYDIKNHVRKNMAYDRLFSVCDRYGLHEEKKKILPEAIIETSSFNYYKELKSMYDFNDWKYIKEDIISKIKPSNSYTLEKIYQEENEVDKLFALLNNNPSMSKFEMYQDILKDKYSNELIKVYGKEIIEESINASNREAYRRISHYIKRMGELNDSDEKVIDMLIEMYPFYKSKKAFKDEILNVLNSKNKDKFNYLISK